MNYRFIPNALAALALVASAQVAAQAAISVAFTPATAAASTPVTAALTYSGVAALGVGTKVVLCYDSTRITFASAAYVAPPGESQPAQDQAAGPLCAAPNDRQVALNWVSSSGTWPSGATSGTLAPSGPLANVSFTTTAGFTSGSTTAVAVEDNVDTSYTFASGNGVLAATVVGPVTPSVSVAASPATLVDAASNVATVTFTSSAPAPAGNLSVTFTPPAAGGLIASTNCTSPITITAGSTTATCTVTAAVNAVPGDGPTVGTITVGAGAGYTVGAPASATVTVNNDDVAPGVPAVSVAVAPAALVDAAGNVATVTFTSSLPAPAGGLSVAITPATVGGLIAGTTCASPVTIAAGATTATCTITAVDNTTPGDGPTAGVTTVLAGAGYSVGAPASATVNVTNNDAVPVVPAVFVTAAPNVVGDSGGVITLTFTATSVPAAPLTVNITPPTVGGLIASTTCGATVTITPPATTATCTVTAAANTVPGEAPTASTATVLAGTGYTVGDLPTANISVTDDDAAPVGAATPVPTMGVFGLGLMGLLIAGFAGFAQRRRSNTNA
jgi:hypothetical protein